MKVKSFFKPQNVAVLKKSANLEIEGGVLYYTIGKVVMFVFQEGKQNYQKVSFSTTATKGYRGLLMNTRAFL